MEPTLFDYVTLTAIVLGPVVAVLVARQLEANAQSRVRRLSLFRSLMATRRTPTTPEHVTALNTIEVEFHGAKNVIVQYKTHIDLMPEQPRLDSERTDIPDLPYEEVKRRDEKYNRRVGEMRHESLAALLHAMADKLGMKMDKHDVFRGGYNPEALAILELEQTVLRRLLVDIASHRRSLPVTVYDQPQPLHQQRGDG